MRGRMEIAIALPATAALLLPAAAMAGKMTVNEAVTGDTNSKVKLVFKTQGEGPPTKDISIMTTNVDSTCPEGGEFSKKLTGIGLAPTGTYLGQAAINDTLGVRVSGAVDPHAERIKDGKVEFLVLAGGDRIREQLRLRRVQGVDARAGSRRAQAAISARARDHLAAVGDEDRNRLPRRSAA